MRILVTGTQGQVVQALAQRGTETGIEVVTIGRPQMDMADPAQTRSAMEAAIAAFQPSLIVNAAAYTAVDQAEDELELAHTVNALSAEAVAKAAADAGLPIIQISTDYVFDGTKKTPYTESDVPNPQGSYGRSKLAGEQLVAASNPQHLILRTAWVYSPFGKNFVKTMLKLAETRDEISVVADQFGNPTSASDIADGIIAAAWHIMKEPAAIAWGTYHLTGTGSTHWAGFAEDIFRLSAARGGPSANIRHITTAEYPTKAKRPANSQLNCDAFELVFGWKSAPWQDSLADSTSAILPK